jgi:hypothetical protein
MARRYENDKPSASTSPAADGLLQDGVIAYAGNELKSYGNLAAKCPASAASSARGPAAGRHFGRGSVAASPGLYLMGTQFMRRRKSTLIDGAGDDARDLSAHLASYLDGRISCLNQGLCVPKTQIWQWWR